MITYFFNPEKKNSDEEKNNNSIKNKKSENSKKKIKDSLKLKIYDGDRLIRTIKKAPDKKAFTESIGKWMKKELKDQVEELEN